MEGREIYPSAPLRFVAFEARFPLTSTFAATNPPERLRKAFRGQFPRVEQANVQNLEVGPGGVRQGADVRHRFIAKDRTLSVTVAAQVLVVETTSYVRYERFRETIETVLTEIQQLDDVSGILRVGLRYLDEVRLPSPVSELREWSSWVNPALAGALELMPGDTRQFVGLIETMVADQRSLVMRYGAQPHGRIVDPNGPLRIPHDDPDDQPLFFIDIDSYWTSPDDDLPPFETDEILEICDALHRPTREVFERSITEKLREEVLRKERG